MSSSLGYSCSARSYLREIGRSMFIATWWAWPGQRPELLRVVQVDGHQTSTAPSMTPIGPEVAVPPLHRVLLDEAVATEQLDAVEADLHALVGAGLAGQRDLLGEVLARGGAAGGLVGQQPHRLQLDRDVGDHERHRLAVRDRLAERLALLDVRRHVVEHGLAGADRERAPGEPREPHALGVRRAVGRAEDGALAAPRRPSSVSLVSEAARTPIDGSASTVSPSVEDSTRNSTGWPSSSAPTTNSSASAPRGTSDFTPLRT